MKSYRLLLPLALLAAACAPKAVVDLKVPQAPDSKIVVALLDLNTYSALDTISTDAAGKARYSLKVNAGQPEFLYFYYNGTKIASLLLSEGEKAVVTADTLGTFEVEGSPESVRLRDNELSYARFGREMDAATTPAELSAAYLKHYRESLRYVMANPTSLTVIPVLFEQLDANTPLFAQHTDAILFRKITDTLKTVYPDSRYVKSLEKETERRENSLRINTLVGQAKSLGYPDLSLPDFNGVKTVLSELKEKAVLVHFWNSSDAGQKMFNLDGLMPVWKQWHGRGFEIYAVDLNPDKSGWAAVVKAQNLPWINVNDGRGAMSPAAMLYNVGGTPESFLLVDGEMYRNTIEGTEGLRKELQRILK